MVADTDTMGRVLTDPDGRTLYRDDRERTGTVVCVGRCTDTRKPLLHQPGAELRLPPGIAGTLGTVTRPDGGDQVTYDGSPLYWFTGDQHPADTSGVSLLWHAINPQNAPVS
jgi:predicted lipoprotein with Yx(FWY)xxD motif